MDDTVYGEVIVRFFVDSGAGWLERNPVSSKFLLVSAALAIISIPSAFMFGLALPMRMGLDSLLDGTFFSAEIFRFSLLIIGVSALMRPLVVFATMAPGMPEKIEGEHKARRWGRWGRFLVVWGYLAFAIFAVLGFLLDRSLVLSFVLFLWLNSSVAMFVYLVLQTKGFSRKDSVGIRDYFVVSLNWRSYLINGNLLFANLVFVLTTTLVFGYLRTMTLAISPAYCIVSNESFTKAAIVGRTSMGLIVATTTDKDWTPVTIPTGIPWVNPSVFSFINFDEVDRVQWSCDSPEFKN